MLFCGIKYTYMANKPVKESKKIKGKNIRFSDKGHKFISGFCKKNGFNLGAFCEIAAMEKIRIESTKNL